MAKTIFVFIAVILLYFQSGCLAQEFSNNDSTGEHSQILSVLKAEFKKRNPIIDYVELFDIRPLLLDPVNYPEKPNHYLVVARGVRPDLSFQGSFEDELLGLFLMDDSLFSVKKTIDYIPTHRWRDFIVRIEKVWKDSITVRGVDIERGETDFSRRYYLLKQ